MKLTDQDVAALGAANRHRHGYFPKPDHRGFAPAQHDKRMIKFVAWGLAERSAHDEHTITTAGRAAWYKTRPEMSDALSHGDGDIS